MDELLSRGAGCAWRPWELCRPVRSDRGKNLTTIYSRTATATASSGSAVARLEGQ